MELCILLVDYVLITKLKSQLYYKQILSRVLFAVAMMKSIKNDMKPKIQRNNYGENAQTNASRFK